MGKTSATIFQGSFIKALKNQFKLGEDVFFLHGSDDPSSVAKSAPRGSAYFRDNGAIGELYIKQDDGSSTNWTLLATSAPGGATTQVQYNNAGAFAGVNARFDIYPDENLTVVVLSNFDKPVAFRVAQKALEVLLMG